MIADLSTFPARIILAVEVLDAFRSAPANVVHLVPRLRTLRLFGSFRKLGGTLFWGPYNEDPTI